MTRSVFFLFLLLFTAPVWAQVGLSQALAARKNSTVSGLLRAFYEENGYRYAWLNRPSRAAGLLQRFRDAPSLALDASDYLRAEFRRLENGDVLSSYDSLQLEVSLTESALHFLSELRGGNRRPSFGYEGIGFRPDNEDLPARLRRAVDEDRLAALVADVQPKGAAYLQMIALWQRLRSIREGKGFKEHFAMVQAADHNPVLWERLYYFGLHDSLAMPPDAALRLKIIRQAQRFFDANDDGKIRPAFIQALNLPIAQRLNELKESINLVRWTEAWKTQPTNGLLNIPSATAQIMQDGQLVLFTRVIVGKSTTQTPTLTSVIREVVLYPYWYVPRKIAVKEMLPSIRRNPAYLEENRYQVLNDKGKVLNPYSINWNQYNASNFPFTIRQSTGCDNSLGLFKFQFDNPFAVYWHDTPNKGLFALNKRYFSHGCMRFEKAEELGQLLLGANRIAIDTVTEKGCLLNQRPIVLPVARPMPIAVVYSTVWLDADGRLRFYDDVYRKRR